VRCGNDVVLNLQIIEEKLDRKIVIRLDAAHLCRSENHNAWLLFLEEMLHCALIAQIELGPVALGEVMETLLFEPAHQSTAHKTSISSYKNLFRFVHHDPPIRGLAFSFFGVCAIPTS
jgi:hypothetical protein